MPDEIKVRVGHLYGHIEDQPTLMTKLEAIRAAMGDVDDDAHIVVYIDHPLPWLPDGALIMLSSGETIHVCTVTASPKSPLAIPYATTAIALDAARSVMLDGGSAEDAAFAATFMWCLFSDTSLRESEEVYDIMLDDIEHWKDEINAQ